MLTSDRKSSRWEECLCNVKDAMINSSLAIHDDLSIVNAVLPHPTGSDVNGTEHYRMSKTINVI